MIKLCLLLTSYYFQKDPKKAENAFYEKNYDNFSTNQAQLGEFFARLWTLFYSKNINNWAKL
jgi:hypothetical protein